MRPRNLRQSMTSRTVATRSPLRALSRLTNQVSLKRPQDLGFFAAFGAAASPGLPEQICFPSVSNQAQYLLHEEHEAHGVLFHMRGSFSTNWALSPADICHVFEGGPEEYSMQRWRSMHRGAMLPHSLESSRSFLDSSSEPSSIFPRFLPFFSFSVVPTNLSGPPSRIIFFSPEYDCLSTQSGESSRST